MFALFQSLNAGRRDAIRLGLQSAIAAAVFFIVMRALGLPEVFVGTLSAVLIIQPSADGSVGAGIERILATIVGSVIGVMCLLALPYGWGTATALAITMFIINAVAAVRPGWRYGVVAAVALSLGAESNVLQVSIDRGLSIILGAAVGIAVSFVVWPESAQHRFERHVNRAVHALVRRLDHILQATRKEMDPVHSDADSDYHSAWELADSAAKTSKAGNQDAQQKAVYRLRRTYNSILFLDRCLEQGAELSDGRRAEIRERLASAQLLLESRESSDSIDRRSIGLSTDGNDADTVALFGLENLSAEVRELNAALDRLAEQ